MTEEIKAGSKLLAEFEGIKKTTVVGNNTHAYNEVEKAWHKTRYHADYNELMRVVHKIHDVADDYTKKFRGFEIFELGLGSGKKDIFDACVKFVTWYNSLKPKG